MRKTKKTDTRPVIPLRDMVVFPHAKIPFIVGYEKGLAEAKFSGRPMMLFFTATW